MRMRLFLVQISLVKNSLEAFSRILPHSVFAPQLQYENNIDVSYKAATKRTEIKYIQCNISFDPFPPPPSAR